MWFMCLYWYSEYFNLRDHINVCLSPTPSSTESRCLTLTHSSAQSRRRSWVILLRGLLLLAKAFLLRMSLQVLQHIRFLFVSNQSIHSSNNYLSSQIFVLVQVAWPSDSRASMLRTPRRTGDCTASFCSPQTTASSPASEASSSSTRPSTRRPMMANFSPSTWRRGAW